MLLKEEVVKKVKEWQSKFVTPEFVSVRMRAEAEARQLLENKLGHFKTGDLNRFLGFCNTELIPLKRKRETLTRFQRAFIGANKKNIIGHSDAFNEWSSRLWNAPDMQVFNWLDRFWREKGVLGGGAGLPTMILYLRDPSIYNVWLPFTAKGLKNLTGINIGMGRKADNYIKYNEAVNYLIRSPLHLKPQEIDFILYKAGKELGQS